MDIIPWNMPEGPEAFLKGVERLCRVHKPARPPPVDKSEGAVDIVLAGSSLCPKRVPQLQGGG